MIQDGPVKNVVYMVRHTESPYTEGMESTRGLTLERLTTVLKIDIQIMEHLREKND